MRIDATTRAVVTGASRGIGRAVAEALAARGAAVGLLARSEEELDALARELGPRAVALPADVGDREQVRAAVARFIEQRRRARSGRRQRRASRTTARSWPRTSSAWRR